MSVLRSVAEVLTDHVTSEVQGNRPDVFERVLFPVCSGNWEWPRSFDSTAAMVCLQRLGGSDQQDICGGPGRFCASGIGKSLKNLPPLRQVGFQTTRRLLDVQKVSHDCPIGKDTFERVVRATEVEGRRAPALRFGDKRVQALFAVLVVFSLQLRGFTNQEMRALLAQLLGLDPTNYPVGRMTYDLRRLRLHEIIQRIAHSHRNQLTAEGLRITLFFSRTYPRLLGPKLAEIMPKTSPIPSAMRAAFDRLHSEIDACCEQQRLLLKLSSLSIQFLGQRF